MGGSAELFSGQFYEALKRFYNVVIIQMVWWWYYDGGGWLSVLPAEYYDMTAYMTFTTFLVSDMIRYLNFRDSDFQWRLLKIYKWQPGRLKMLTESPRKLVMTDGHPSADQPR